MFMVSILPLVAYCIRLVWCDVQKIELGDSGKTLVESLAMHGRSIVLFHQHFCPQCDALKQVFQDAEKSFTSKETTKTLSTFDCATNYHACEKEGIISTPTVRIYIDGKYKQEIDTSLDAEILLKYVTEDLSTLSTKKETKEESVFRMEHVTHLNEILFKETISASNSHNAIVFFYAHWCGHCQEMKPKYSKVATDVVAGGNETSFYAVNCDDSKNENLCKSQNIEGFPTIKMFRGGKVVGEFEGDTEADLKEFIEHPEKKPASQTKRNSGDNEDESKEDSRREADDVRRTISDLRKGIMISVYNCWRMNHNLKRILF